MNELGRYINFACLFLMFIILPLVSLLHNAIFYTDYFSQTNIMRPFHFCYAMMNLMLILCYFFITKGLNKKVRSILLNQDLDIWRDHLDEILNFKRNSDPELIEINLSHNPNTVTGKFKNFFIGEPIEQQVVNATIHNVTESAAIYRIKRSFERGKDKSKQQALEKQNWYAKSGNWQEPDDEFLNRAYQQIKEFCKNAVVPKTLQYQGYEWSFSYDYSGALDTVDDQDSMHEDEKGEEEKLVELKKVETIQMDDDEMVNDSSESSDSEAELELEDDDDYYKEEGEQEEQLSILVYEARRDDGSIMGLVIGKSAYSMILAIAETDKIVKVKNEN